MTLVLCEKHGTSPVANVCSHLFERLSSGEGNVAFVRIKLTFKGEDVAPSHVCADCLSTLEIDSTDTYKLGTDEAERVFNAATSGWCTSCLTESVKRIV